MKHIYLAFKLYIVMLLISSQVFVSGSCPNYCSGHGICNPNAHNGTQICDCFETYTAPDCSQRTPFEYILFLIFTCVFILVSLYIFCEQDCVALESGMLVKHLESMKLILWLSAQIRVFAIDPL